MKFNTRILFILMLAIPAVAGSLFLKQRVAANYRRTQDLLRAQYLRTAKMKDMETAAAQREGRIANLRHIVDGNPRSIPARWALADALQKAAMITKAREQIESIIGLDPNNKDARIAVSNIDLALGKLPDAEADYRYCTVHWPKDVESWQGLAASRYHQRRYREAADAANRALRLEPEDFFTRFVYATSVLEYSAQFPPTDIRADAVMSARRVLRQMTKDDPGNADVWYKLGRTCFLIMDKGGAVESMRRAYELAPDRQDISLDLAQTLIATGDRVAARKIAETAVSRFPNNPGLHYTLSDLLQNSKDADAKQRALDEANKAVAAAPREVLFLERLGASYLALGNLDEARKAYETSLKIDENRARPYQQLAAIYTRLGDPKRGSVAAKMATRMVYNDQTLRQVQELNSKYTDAIPLKLILADRYRDLKMTGAARDTYLEILQLDPNNARAQSGLAAIAAQHQLARIPAR